MKNYFLKIFFILVCTLIGCDFSTPKGNLIAPISNTEVRYPALVIPEGFTPSPMIAVESQKIESTKNLILRKGFNDNQVITIQLEELKSLNEFFRNNTTSEGTKFIGQIEGYSPGMTLEEYIDQTIQITITNSKDYPIEFLKELRLEIVSWIFSLQLIKSRCNVSTSEECKTISNISDKYLFLREEIIKIITEKSKAEMGI